MCVYNTPEAILRESIESILKQTFSNFEFIIVLDSPTDNSSLVVKSYREDKRIIVLENDNNIGLTKSLNKGLSIAKGKYIARMDSDDISLPNRFEIQFKYLEKHKNLCGCGSYICVFDNSFRATTGMNFFTNNPRVEPIRLLFGNAGIPHPTAMLRKSFLDENDIKYDERFKKSQDYSLWIDIYKNKGRMGLLKQVLLLYRVSSFQISNKSNLEQNTYQLSIMKDLLMNLIDCSTDDLEINKCFRFLSDHTRIASYEQYAFRLIRCNKIKRIYHHPSFKKEIKKMWLVYCIRLLRKKKFLFLKYKLTYKSFLNPLVAFGVARDFFSSKKYLKSVKKTRSKCLINNQMVQPF